MDHGLLRCCLAMLLLLLAVPAAAQCVVQGEPVPVVLTDDIPGADVAYARWDGGRAAILLHPATRGLAHPIQLFLFEHECAHALMLAKVGVVTLHAEIDADCHAITRLTRAGLLDADGLELIAGFLYPNPARPPWYPPGPVRARRIGECYRRALSG